MAKNRPGFAARCALAALFSFGFGAPGPSGAQDLSDIHFSDLRKPGAGPAAPKGAAVVETTEDFPGSVDLLPQFPDASDHNQVNVGSCHAFSTISVLEAALFRRYQQHIALSEADLFLQRTVLRGQVNADFDPTALSANEGNDVVGDVYFAITNGVATSDQYGEFVKRYTAFRDTAKQDSQYVDRMVAQENALQKFFDKTLFDARQAYKDTYTPEAKRGLTGYLSSVNGRQSIALLESERARTKAMLAGFRALQKSYPYMGNASSSVDAAACGRLGTERGAAILRELKAGRPVAVSMSLSGLPEWDQTDASRDANHAFTLVGYALTQKGVSFHTRNSWGGKNPDVPDSQLCRVYNFVTVLTPQEPGL